MKRIKRDGAIYWTIECGVVHRKDCPALISQRGNVALCDNRGIVEKWIPPKPRDMA